jgi:hypothetical protein
LKSANRRRTLECNAIGAEAHEGEDGRSELPHLAMQGSDACPQLLLREQIRARGRPADQVCDSEAQREQQNVLCWLQELRRETSRVHRRPEPVPRARKVVPRGGAVAPRVDTAEQDLEAWRDQISNRSLSRFLELLTGWPVCQPAKLALRRWLHHSQSLASSLPLATSPAAWWRARVSQSIASWYLFLTRSRDPARAAALRVGTGAAGTQRYSAASLQSNWSESSVTGSQMGQGAPSFHVEHPEQGDIPQPSRTDHLVLASCADDSRAAPTGSSRPLTGRCEHGRPSRKMIPSPETDQLSSSRQTCHRPTSPGRTLAANSAYLPAASIRPGRTGPLPVKQAWPATPRDDSPARLVDHLYPAGQTSHPTDEHRPNLSHQLGMPANRINQCVVAGFIGVAIISGRTWPPEPS